MLSKRVLVVAADKALAKRAAAGIMAAGATAEIVAAPEDLGRDDRRADLVVLHTPGTPEEAEQLVRDTSGHLRAAAHLIVLIPTPSLVHIVRVMQAGRVEAVIVVDELETRQLAAVASRLLFGDIFGLEKVVPW